MALARAVVMVLATASAASAQPAAGDLERPGYRQQRSDEDWSVLRDASRRRDWWDPIKFVPLRTDQTWYLTLGGEFRPFYERYDHYNWGAGPDDGDGYYLERLMVHADVRMGPRARAFVEVKHGIAIGRVGGPRPPDEDRLDLNQAFVDIRLGPTPGSDVVVRLGRQELDYGDGSLVSYREGPNVRRGYDGAKVMLGVGIWQVDAFSVRPVETDPGVFDDGAEPGQRFWGVYAAARRPLRRPFGRPEVYYLGAAREHARYDQGVGRERRHTVGVRSTYRKGGLDCWLEATFQSGSFGGGRIRAWKHVQVYGYRFEQVRLRPRLGLNVAVSSGDKDPRDVDLQTFHPLFPKGLYYGYIDSSGSLNAIVAHPSLALQLSTAVAVRGEVFGFWRQQTTDGLYAQPGHLLRTGQQSAARGVGTLAQTDLTWRLDAHATVTLQAGRYWVGAYLRDTPPARDLNYVSAKMSYKF